MSAERWERRKCYSDCKPTTSDRMLNRRLTVESCCMCHVSSLQTGFPGFLFMTQTHARLFWSATLHIFPLISTAANCTKAWKKKKNLHRQKDALKSSNETVKKRAEAQRDERRTVWSIIHLWILIVLLSRRSIQQTTAPRPLSMNERCEGRKKEKEQWRDDRRKPQLCFTEIWTWNYS